MFDDTAPFPDDVPVADATEQLQPTADPVVDELAGAVPPLESDPGDWQDQHRTLEHPDDDDRR